MSASTCRFIKHVVEFVPAELSKNIPYNTRGIYALLKRHSGDRYDVIYVGMSGRGKDPGMWGRLGSHRRDKRLKLKWTHFTLFEVHDNITAEEIRELEGLIRHMYRKDSQANRYNRQLCHKPFMDGSILVAEKHFRKREWST